MIENIEAVKPDDWNEDREGIWEPPKIKNPKYRDHGLLNKLKILTIKENGQLKNYQTQNTRNN